MDIEIFKGQIQGQEVSLGMLKKKRVIAFMRDKKYLVPRDLEKKLIPIPQEYDIDKLKKSDSAIGEIISYYLNRRDLEQSTFVRFLREYYLLHVVKKDELIEQLDEAGKNLLGKLIDKILDPRYIKQGSCLLNYWKEGKVISSYCWLDMELLFDTFLNQIDRVFLENKEPVVTYPLRYSISELSSETEKDLLDIFSERVKQWFKWREVLRKEPDFYNYIVHWIFTILDKFYPEDQEAIKELSQKAEQAEIFANPGIITSLQQGQDFEVETLKDVTFNKQLLYYFSMQYLYDGKELRFKRYNTASFGYQDIFASLANSYGTIPLFTALNPPYSFTSQILVEWALANLDFSALRGNPQIDPYNLMSNVLSFLLSIASAKAESFEEMKYFAAKIIQTITTDEILKEAIKAKKTTELSMQGKQGSDVEVDEKEVEEQKKTLQDILTTYINTLNIAEDRKKELEEIANGFDYILKPYDEVKNEKTKYLKINPELAKELNDFQKDFMLSLQLTGDIEILNKIAEIFVFFNKAIEHSDASTINALALQMWLISLSKGGKLDWLKEEATIKNEYETLVKTCFLTNTPLPGFIQLKYPIAEMTSPTLIVFSANNVKDMLVLKDISEKQNVDLYAKVLANLEAIY